MRLFSRLGAAMDEVRKVQAGTVMSVQTLQVLFMVAAKEGISFAEIRKLSGIAQASVSRALGDLGDRARRRQAEGALLVKTELDPNDHRHRLCYLTPKGKALVARIEQLIGTKICDINKGGKEMAETIDLTPTWSAILPALLLAYKDGENDGPRMALVELRRMATLADKYVELAKQGKIDPAD